MRNIKFLSHIISAKDEKKAKEMFKEGVAFRDEGNKAYALTFYCGGTKGSFKVCSGDRENFHVHAFNVIHL